MLDRLEQTLLKCTETLSTINSNIEENVVGCARLNLVLQCTRTHYARPLQVVEYAEGLIAELEARLARDSANQH